jgi:hypothetical protein
LKIPSRQKYFLCLWNKSKYPFLRFNPRCDVAVQPMKMGIIVQPCRSDPAASRAPIAHSPTAHDLAPSSVGSPASRVCSRRPQVAALSIGPIIDEACRMQMRLIHIWAYRSIYHHAAGRRGEDAPLVFEPIRNASTVLRSKAAGTDFGNWVAVLVASANVS